MTERRCTHERSTWHCLRISQLPAARGPDALPHERIAAVLRALPADRLCALVALERGRAQRRRHHAAGLSVPTRPPRQRQGVGSVAPQRRAAPAAAVRRQHARRLYRHSRGAQRGHFLRAEYPGAGGRAHAGGYRLQSRPCRRHRAAQCLRLRHHGHLPRRCRHRRAPSLPHGRARPRYEADYQRSGRRGRRRHGDLHRQ